MHSTSRESNETLASLGGAYSASVRMPRKRTRPTVTWMLALLAGACVSPDFGSACIMGPCGGGYHLTHETYILGFPADRVDRSNTHPGDGGYWGRVDVGDTVRFHLVRAPSDKSPTAEPPDTIRPVSWMVSDSTVADIASAPSGQGILVARSPGATRVLANDQHFVLWACEDGGCSRVSEIEVRR